jgi:hypothetical protein
MRVSLQFHFLFKYLRRDSSGGIVTELRDSRPEDTEIESR